MLTGPRPSPSIGARELLSLHAVAQEVAGDLKVVPGNRWGYFYPDGTPVALAEKILSGQCSAADVGTKMKPKALIYDQSLLADTEAKEYILPSIRASTHFVAHANFERQARMVEACREKALSARQILHLHDTLAENALYAHALKMYGSTGSRDIKTIAANRADLIAGEIGSLVGLDKVLKVLQLQSLVQDLRCGANTLLLATTSLDQTEAEMVKQLTPVFRRFTEHPDELTWTQLLKPILDTIPTRPKPPEKEEAELKEFEDHVSERDDHDMVSPEDRDDYEQEAQSDEAEADDTGDDERVEQEGEAHTENDEYHTPDLPPQSEGGPKEQREKKPLSVIFTITPKEAGDAPLGNYYIEGRHSYYDFPRKTWAKRKNLSAYIESTLESKRYLLSGKLKAGLTAIPLPHGYGIVIASVPGVTFVQDQYGCVYVQCPQSVHCQLEFGKLQTRPDLTPPVAADLERLHKGVYDQKIERFLKTVQGDPVAKATQLAGWIKSHKSYPKDLKAAHALQLKLRTQSAPENYLPTLATSAKLECYSSATLFVDWCRRSQVPARLVIGQHIQSAKKGECLITDDTGHAWAEIWDGHQWIRVDATPPQRQEKDNDEKKDKSKDSKDETHMDKPEDEAAVDVPSDPSLPEQVQDRQDAQAEQMEQAISQEEMEGADQQMQQMQEAMRQAQGQKQQIQKQIDQAQSFQELEQKKNDIDKNDQLFDDMKEELKEKAKEKKEAMKDDLEQQLDKLAEEGFMEADDAEKLKARLENEAEARKLDQLAREIKEQSQLEQEYERLVEEVSPLVDEWYDYFLEVLPKRKDPDFDPDTLARTSHLDRRALKRPRTLVTGIMRNPLRIIESLIPKFIASIVVDVSGSMAGEKLAIARKVLVFYCELFSRIAKSHDYLKFAINIFSDSMTTIKDYDQEYAENTFYEYAGGVRTTVKARIMKAIHTQGGTNMLDALKAASEALTNAVDGDREYASALYLLGDGGDTCGNQARIKQLVSADGEANSGDHMYAAMVLGSENDRKVLAELFGDDRTAVADTFEGQIEISMKQFLEDIVGYLEAKARN